MRCRHRHGHRHFNRFLVSLVKCAGSRRHVFLICASAVIVSDDECQAVKVASRAPLTRGRADTETFRCQVDRSHRAVYPGSFLRRLLHALDSAGDRIGGLAFISLPSQRLKLALNWLSELWWDCSVCATGFITLMDRCGPLAARCAFSAKSVVPELILFGRRVPVDSHGAGGGRNRVDPVTRHRNTGCCSERVAHFLRCLHDPLWLCREHYVFARISSKCRCAKCEREHDTRASNRRTTQATKPVFYSHAVIMIPFRILGKLV